jgi:hypothetical protein
MARKRQAIDEIIEKKVCELREMEKAKIDELAEIQRELRRHEAALESLKGNVMPKKRKIREENGLLS